MTLRDARKKRGMTQDDLAAASGVDQTMISSVEIGRRSPSDDVKTRLAKALGIAPSKLRFATLDPAGSVGKPRVSRGHERTRTPETAAVR
jgi:transcriptional regulator with XRE-family HTH domain